MKLCTICDKKIDGTWCKNCHRFVKVYDLPEGIHFNESHDPGNDADCTYHVDVKKNGNSTYTTATRQTYTQTATRAQSTTGQRSAGNGRKKGGKGKLAVILIVLYLVFNIIATLIPTITNCVGALSEELKDSFYEDEQANHPFDEIPPQEDVEYEEKLAAIEKLVSGCILGCSATIMSPGRFP